MNVLTRVEVEQIHTATLDVIRAVGPVGNYLAQRHTCAHMRERWMPELMDRRPYIVWERQGDSAREWALAKAQQILTDYYPEPLDPALDAALSRIIAAQEAGASQSG